MTDTASTPDTEPDALLSRLRVIEDQPLATAPRRSRSCTTSCARRSRRETRPDRMPDAARLDAELVRRGLARSRALAVEAIDDGRVTVDGVPALKASHRVGRMPSSRSTATTR